MLLLEGGLLGDQALEVVEALGIEAPLFDRQTDGAAGFAIVLAVSEAALVHQLEHVAEGLLDAVTGQPQRQCPDARRVDEPAPVVRNTQQLGSDRCVPATLVAANLGGGLALFTERAR